MLRWLVGLTFTLAVLAGGGFVAFSWWQDRAAVPKLAGAIEQAGTATVGEGEALASLDARDIYHAGQERDRTIVTQREVIREQILAAPGADQPLAPGLIASINRGVCQRPAYHDDPRCVPLR